MKKANPTPPRILRSFLLWFCREEWVEEIEGDLAELYHEELETIGAFRARLHYLFRMLRFFKPSNMEFLYSHPRMMLLGNYLLIARRTLIRNKRYSLFNLLAFSMGLTAGYFMLVYVTDELSYDKHYHRAEDIYRVAEHVYMEGGPMHSAVTPAAVGAQLAKEMPEIESWTTFTFFNRITFEGGGENHTDPNGRLVSSTYLDVFDPPFLYGDAKTALKTPGSLVISRSRALKYFGTTDIIGKTVKTEHFGTMIITGVMKDPVPNSHFHLHLLFFAGNERFTGDWEDHSYYTYIKLKKNANRDLLEARFPAFFQEHLAEPLEEVFAASGDIFLQPVTDIHLHSELNFELEPNGSRKYVIAMGSLAIFILIVLSINYINMAIAQATRRVREVGVRKVLGSNGQMIIYQFFIESCILVGLAAVVALFLIPVILPYFNVLSGKKLAPEQFYNLEFVLLFILIVFLTGLASASYPAFFLSRFKANEVLKKTYSLGRFNFPVNKVLNSFQIAVSLVMIMLTWTLFQQINYARTNDLGFESDQVFKINLKQRINLDHLETMRSQLMALPGVVDVAAAKQSPGEAVMSDGLEFESATKRKVSIKTAFNASDHHFFDVLQMKLLAGRAFDPAPRSWGHEAVVNRALVEKLGYKNPEDILNTQVELPLGEDHQTYIVGVVENVHFESLHHQVTPYILVDFLPITSSLLVRTEDTKLSDIYDGIDKVITQLTNSSSHELSLLDQQYWSQYQADEMQGNVLIIFSSIVIFLSFAGLAGLIAMNLRFKAKEINIRKVFGASFGDIFKIYSRQYSAQVLFSILIAVPIALLLANNWLENFAYRIPLPIWSLIMLILILCLLVGLTISIQCWKSTSVNPTIYLSEE